MASENEKQTYNKERYKEYLRDGKKSYETIKEFIASFSYPATEEEEVQVVTPTTPTDAESSTGNAVPDEGIATDTGVGVDDSKGLIALAKTKMKAPYVFGAAGPNTFDCSGFVCWVFNHRGYKFGRSTAAGYHSMFTKIDTPTTGDIIFLVIRINQAYHILAYGLVTTLLFTQLIKDMVYKYPN
ncbi:NlpC/P60 family protein [Priestia megaterium]